MSGNNFFEELKRRNVYQVGVTYIIVAWLVLQVVSVVSPMIDAPDWIGKFTLIFLMVCFPIAIILAWAYEMSPEGVRRTSHEVSDSRVTEHKRRKPGTKDIINGLLFITIVGHIIYVQWSRKPRVPEILEKSIAVLPFINESSNQENQYFCNGVMTGIADHLAKIPELIVLSRSSVEQFRQNPPSASVIGQQLSVGYLVEGSVQRIGDQAVIFAQLIDAKNEKHLWSHRYDRRLTDVLKIQAEITESIADALHTVISPDLKERIESIPTADPLAFDHYLKGSEFLYAADHETQRNEEWNDQLTSARVSFELSLERDSTFVQPIIGLARVEYIQSVEAEILSENYLDEVVELCTKAINIDPKASEAFSLRAQAHYRNSRIDLARSDLRSALTLSPNNLESLVLQMEIHRFVDLNFIAAIEDAKEIEKRASSTSELWKLYDSYWWMAFQVESTPLTEYFGEKKQSTLPSRFSGLYWSLERGGKLEEAWEILNRESTEENQFGLLMRGEHNLHMGKYSESVSYYKRWYELVTEESEDNWLSVNDWHRYGQALYGVGELTLGREMFQKQIDINLQKVSLNRTGFSGLSPFYDLAGIYAFLGQKEEAYHWLDEFDQRDGWYKLGILWHIKRDRLFDNLREDERFTSKIEEVEARTMEYRRQVEGAIPFDLSE